MSTTTDSYLIGANYYDGAYGTMDLSDAHFYFDLAKERGGPVLEIGCGTGRVLLPIARAGIEIHGVDNSVPMFDVLRKKMGHEPADVQRRITLHDGDMRNFRLNRTFPLVTIPFRPMQHMHTVEDQVRALETAAAHLTDDGILAFEVFYPKFELINAKIGEEVAEMEWKSSSEPSAIVRRYFRKESVDKINQVFNFTFIYRTFKDNKVIAEEVENFNLSFYTYPHLRALFLLTGLEVMQEYGSFARTPLDNRAEQMIFLLRRALA